MADSADCFLEASSCDFLIRSGLCSALVVLVMNDVYAPPWCVSLACLIVVTGDTYYGPRSRLLLFAVNYGGCTTTGLIVCV